MSGEFSVEVNYEDPQCTTVKLVGEGPEVDAITVPVLTEAIDRAIDQARGATLSLDLSNVAYIDSTGLGTLMGVHRRLLKSDPPGELIIYHPSDKLLKVFEITGLSEVFKIEPVPPT